MNQVNFSVRVGTVVPTRVRAIAVPAAIVEVHPEFRNHLFVVVRDEIVIMDRSRRIVAVIPADSGGRVGARGGSGAQVAVDLSPDEIRKVQLVLIERGFDLEADGVFGARTRQALVEFQRREGLQVTGRIDSRTVTALGVSVQTRDQESTTGRGGDRQQGGTQQPSGQQPSAQQPSDRSPAGQQGKSMDDNRRGSQAGSGQGADQPSTTGQGRDAGKGAPAKSDGTSGQGKTNNPPTKQAPQGGSAPSGAGSSGGTGGAGGSGGSGGSGR